MHHHCRKAFKQALTMCPYSCGSDEPWNRSILDIKSTDETSGAHTQMPRLFITLGIQILQYIEVKERQKSKGGDVTEEEVK